MFVNFYLLSFRHRLLHLRFAHTIPIRSQLHHNTRLFIASLSDLSFSTTLFAHLLTHSTPNGYDALFSLNFAIDRFQHDILDLCALWMPLGLSWRNG